MTASSAGLLDLPLEILTHIVGLLLIKDIEALRNVCKPIRDFLKFEQISQQALLQNAAYSLEGTQSGAAHSIVPFSVSLKRIIHRRDRLRLGRPANCFCLGRASSFLFHQGVLIALTRRDEIRIVDVNGAFQTENIIQLQEFVKSCNSRIYDGQSWHRATKLLRYMDGYLVCLLEHFVLEQPHKIHTLVVFNVENGCCIMLERVSNAEQISVFHNTEYLYIGRPILELVPLAAVGPPTPVSMAITSPGGSAAETPTIPRYEGWEVEGWRLRRCSSTNSAATGSTTHLQNHTGVRHKAPYSSCGGRDSASSSLDGYNSSFITVRAEKILSTLEFDKFTTYGFGKSSCFAIHNGYFYAVTTQANLSPDDFEYTSFYYCYRFRLDSPPSQGTKLNPSLVIRRNFDEGPVNDGWTTLSLVSSERTGILQIIESRREWLGNDSVATRSYYVEELTEDMFDPEFNNTSRFQDKNNLQYMPQDYRSLMEHYSPEMLFAPTQHRSPSKVHRGEAMCVSLGPSDYLLRTYDPGSNVWLDVIENDSDGPFSKTFLRVGSRRQESTPSAEATYVTNKTREWRLPNAQKDNSFSVLRSGETSQRAIADERSIVYFSSNPDDEPGIGRLMLITFDPELDFSGTKPYIPLSQRSMLKPTTVLPHSCSLNYTSSPGTAYEWSEVKSDREYVSHKRRKTASPIPERSPEYPSWFSICNHRELETLWADGPL